MKLVSCLAVDTSVEAAVFIAQWCFSPACSGLTIGRGHDYFSCSRMSWSDENRLPTTPPQFNKEKRNRSTMFVGGVQWDVSDRMDPGFVVREIWVSISALSLTLLSFCCLTDRIWLISWWGLGRQGLYQDPVVIGIVLRTLFMNLFHPHHKPHEQISLSLLCRRGNWSRGKLYNLLKVM